MKFFAIFMVSAALVLGLSGTLNSADAAKAKKKVSLTEAQKKELRRRGREWCMKNHVKGTAAIDRVEILSDGRIRCWVRG